MARLSAKDRRNQRRETFKLQQNSTIMEAYRMLQTNISFYSVDKKLQTIMLTSTMPEEGKSTTVSNLAYSFAQSDKRVLVVDLDLRKPVLHKIFNVSSATGLTTVITGKSRLEDSIKATDIDNLFVLPCGVHPPNPTEILRSETVKQIINYLKSKYDIILIDTPPAVALTDAAIASSFCDAVILVVSSGKVDYASVDVALKNLKLVNANVIGVVVNNVKGQGNRRGYYYRYKYRYYY